MTRFDGTWRNAGIDPFSEAEFDLTYAFSDASFTMTDHKTNKTMSGTFSFIVDEENENLGTVSFVAHPAAVAAADEWLQNFLFDEDKLGLQIDEEDHWNGWFLKQ